MVPNRMRTAHYCSRIHYSSLILMDTIGISRFMDQLVARASRNDGEQCYLKIYGKWFGKRNAKIHSVKSYTLEPENYLLRIYFARLESINIVNPGGVRIEGENRFIIKFSTSIFQPFFDIKYGYSENHWKGDFTENALDFRF